MQKRKCKYFVELLLFMNHKGLFRSFLLSKVTQVLVNQEVAFSKSEILNGNSLLSQIGDGYSTEIYLKLL